MRYKILSVFVLFILALVIAGCGNQGTTAAPSQAMNEGAQGAQATQPAPQADNTQAMEGETTQEQTAQAEAAQGETVQGEGDVTENTVMAMEDKSLAVDSNVESDKFEGASCTTVDGVRTITVKITNTGDSTWIADPSAGKMNVRISNRGIPDASPGCEPASIEPGESTVCSTIDVGVIGADKGDNRVSIQTLAGTDARIVSCA